MSDWLHNLPLIWMTLVVFGVTYLFAALLQKVVGMLATRERAPAFKAVSPGMLPPLGILFGLFVAFTAAQVWNDIDRANTAVNREASSLKTVLVLAATFPGDSEARLRSLVRRHIEEIVTHEWPMMVRHTATMHVSPPSLVEALQQTFALSPNNPGQQIAQREIVTSIENALEARRQRILISQSRVNLTKWACIFLQAACALLAIAAVHIDNRLASTISLGVFATGVATSVILILAHDEPFAGQISVGFQPLLQVMPDL
jgi:hypothetical protein